jgi:curved DNA-binding protein
MSIPFQDYYEILGVDRKAQDKEIKSAYRKLARKWHPDLHSGKDKEKAEEKIKQINEAYEVLKDKEKREKYDRLGANWRAGEDFHPSPDMGDFHFYTGTDTAGNGFSDFFRIIFGDDFGRGARTSRRRGPMRGQDVESELELTLEEAYRGGEKSLQVTSKEACQACAGTGSDGRTFCPRCGGIGVINRMKNLAVKIPAGVTEGSKIRLKGQGGEGYDGGDPGDLYFKVRILPHRNYKIQGDDLEVEATLRPEQAVLGDQVTVPTLDGPVYMKVPAGTRAGRRLRLKGKGLPNRGGRGDQYVLIKIDIPEHLTAEEERLYKQLAASKKGV